ncbi:hypothetical protein MASR2M78_08160 [Treponema sp.]
MRVLTTDEFVQSFIRGRKEYSDIAVVENLHFALDELLSELDPKMEFGSKKAEIIGDRVLSSSGDTDKETVQMKFEAEIRKLPDIEEIKESGKILRIAAVDDDFVIQELLKTTFSAIGATVIPYSDGDEFLAVADTEKFDLVFLDLKLPRWMATITQELKARYRTQHHCTFCSYP